MRKVLEHILAGEFTTEDRALDFSCSKIEMTAYLGQTCEGSFHVYSAEGVLTEGFITSSDMRMEVVSGSLSGSDSEIVYRFHSEVCQDGDVVKGAFSVISNLGEYYIPFVVTVEQSVPDSSVGQIRNLFHFANLAKSNWKEAVSLFYSDAFYGVLSGNDAQYTDAYRALSAVPGNERNMEEFLLYINKKQPLEYLSHTPEITLNLSGTDTELKEREIEILRNGWGYTSLEIRCEGDFLFTERHSLSDDDFLGNVCYLRVFMDTAQLGYGRHFGKVILLGTLQRLEIPVELHIGITQPGKGAERIRKQIGCRILEQYLQLRLKQITTKVWMTQTGRLVEQLADLDEKDMVAKLYQAQLLITDGRSNEAGWILDQTADLLEAAQRSVEMPQQELDFIFCYHSYLTTLVRSEEEYAAEEARRVEQVFRKGGRDWRIGWLLFYLPTQYSTNLVEKWRLMETLFAEGCRSPILYMEGLLALNQNPLVVRKVSGFATQVLLFGARRGVLRQESLEQVLFLFEKEKTYQPLLLKAMIYLYGDFKDKRLLQEICGQLIKGRRRDRTARVWYRLGAEQQLKIPGLYEYYMYSLDLEEQEEIPKNVLLYFSYANQLDAEHLAYFYHYLIRNRREQADLLKGCREAMERFAVEQIRARRIDRHLAAIYDEVLLPAHLERGIAQNLADLLYANWMTMDRNICRRVYIYQSGFCEPWRYDLERGEGWVSIYGNDYLVVLEDTEGNRYLKSIDYTLEKLMLSGRFLKAVAEQVWDNPRLNFLLCMDDRSETDVTSENVSRFQFLAEFPGLERRLRRDMAFRALDYYREAEEDKQVEISLRKLDKTDMRAEEKNRYFQFLCFRDDPREAMDFLGENTPYFADLSLLGRVLDRVLSSEMQPNALQQRVLYFGSLHLMNRGKADALTMEYLMARYQSQSRDLRDAWKAAQQLQLDTKVLERRLLVQMLYSGAFVGERETIFQSYVEHGGDEDVILAFLLQSAHDYFVSDKVVSEFVFRELEKRVYEQYFGRQETQGGRRIPQVAEFALLKFFAEYPKALREESRQLVLGLLDRMMEQRIHLGFFREYLSDLHFPDEKQRERLEQILDELSDKTIIDYHARSGNAAKIHYIIFNESADTQAYQEEYMQDVCDGVCFKEFVLFFGESLQYYITEEQDGKMELTTSGNLQKSDITGEASDGKYDLINDLLISLTLQDYGTFDQLLTEYRHKEFLNRELFRLQ